jgi:N-acetylmuramoyl-L-alanine amidase
MHVASRLLRRCARAGASLLGACLLVCGPGPRGLGASARAADEAPQDRFDTVVIDAGHGGEDEGAQGPGGLAEKELVLDVARRLASRLRRSGLHVVLTRDSDRFVPLETRTSLANDARADLFVSIHANAARSPAPSGIETYFVSLEASDESAQLVARRENDAFGGSAALAAGQDPLVALLGDMIATEYVLESSEFAGLAQRELARIKSVSSRGVKQAPFVVLMGVQMPASLVEIGFITNPEEERALRGGRRRDAIAEGLAKAVAAFGERFDARRGIARLSATD